MEHITALASAQIRLTPESPLYLCVSRVPWESFIGCRRDSPSVPGQYMLPRTSSLPVHTASRSAVPSQRGQVHTRPCPILRSLHLPPSVVGGGVFFSRNHCSFSSKKQ